VPADLQILFLHSCPGLRRLMPANAQRKKNFTLSAAPAHLSLEQFTLENVACGRSEFALQQSRGKLCPQTLAERIYIFRSICSDQVKIIALFPPPDAIRASPYS
jgi:hypothetical protein